MQKLLKFQSVCNTGGQFFLIMCDDDECLVRATAEVQDYLTYEAAVAVVETVERFVENEEFGVFDEGTCQQAESLLSAAELEE